MHVHALKYVYYVNIITCALLSPPKLLYTTLLTTSSYSMDRDALKAEFQALVTPFEEDRERAAALLPRDIPEEDIFEILRKMKTAGFLEMPKLLEKAEEASMLVHRALGSLVAERTAVYTKLIPKLMSEVTRKVGSVRVV
jgi:hypothetical protein